MVAFRLSYRKIRLVVLIRGIRKLCLLIDREPFIIIDHVIELVQIQLAFRRDIILTITRVTDDLSVSGVDLPYPRGLPGLVL